MAWQGGGPKYNLSRRMRGWIRFWDAATLQMPTANARAVSHELTDKWEFLWLDIGPIWYRTAIFLLGRVMVLIGPWNANVASNHLHLIHHLDRIPALCSLASLWDNHITFHGKLKGHHCPGWIPFLRHHLTPSTRTTYPLIIVCHSNIPAPRILPYTFTSLWNSLLLSIQMTCFHLFISEVFIGYFILCYSLSICNTSLFQHLIFFLYSMSPSNVLYIFPINFLLSLSLPSRV